MLASIATTALLLLAGTQASPLGDLAERQAACQSVHVFIARGSTEPYPGRQGALATAICSGISSCGYEDITYPATFDNYCTSAQAGVVNGKAAITAYAARCPNAKLVLTGYSQGAHVIGDILGGGGGNLGSCTQQTSTGLSRTSSPGNKIAAALFFGDVRHVASQSYNTGSGAAGAGMWPRSSSQLSSLNTYSSVMRSWCLSGDNVCAAGGRDPSAHTSYFNVFTQEAAAWVKTKL
ncbi:Alpha/Beta hydrolase protein [Microdochium trichocladiopsis]|uniref:Alpha/Beta hydrolase protein n=1 Tax=Microdochium trichocladiopsis TaxID=1682393 RepID=A0A9P8XX40_9PEZI|nr:Alpha/Beta hydrolase protein [Microdochium trichocladiopsis]KAH7024438.1 Alpha/Beta hydrolase protein [Microdochium trichocladiopsis]